MSQVVVGSEMLSRVDLVGVPVNPSVNVEALCSLLRKKGSSGFVTFINPASWVLARRHPEYLEALKHMTFNVIEKPSVAWLSHALSGTACTHLNFANKSLTSSLFKTMIEEGSKVMLIGGKPGYDEHAQTSLETAYPGVKIVGTLHAYGEYGTMIAAVMARKPNVVLVDMGSPRQEDFLMALAKAGFKGVAITCQGFFLHYLGEEAFYPRWIEQWNLQAVWRLYKASIRSWNGHIRNYSFFVVQAVMAIKENYRNRAPQTETDTANTAATTV